MQEEPVPNILISALLVVIAVLGPKPVVAGPSTMPGTDPSEVAVRVDKSGAVIVPVHINGNGPFRFLLDTGSSHSVVSRSLIEQLGLHFVAKTSVLTYTGREWRPVVKLNQTTIGGAQSDGLLASVASAAQLDVFARSIQGIIGQDFLFAFNYTLDYRRQRLAWNDGESNAGDVRLPLVARGGRYLARIAPAGDVPEILLVPDSGASGFVAYERDGRTKLAAAFAGFAARRFGEPGSAAAPTLVHSLSGGQRVRTMMLRELRLGSLKIREQPVAVIPRDADDVAEGDGLLPLHLFASVSFNAREQCLVVRYAE